MPSVFPKIPESYIGALVTIKIPTKVTVSRGKWVVECNHKIIGQDNLILLRDPWITMVNDHGNYHGDIHGYLAGFGSKSHKADVNQWAILEIKSLGFISPSNVRPLGFFFDGTLDPTISTEYYRKGVQRSVSSICINQIEFLQDTIYADIEF